MVEKWRFNGIDILQTLPSNNHIGNLDDSELHFLPVLL